MTPPLRCLMRVVIVTGAAALPHAGSFPASSRVCYVMCDVDLQANWCSA